MTWITIVYTVFVLDALIANYLAWTGKQHWWQEHFAPIARHFPLARGWTLYYLILVLLAGIILWHDGLIVLP